MLFCSDLSRNLKTTLVEQERMEARLQMNFVLLAVDAQNYLVLGNPTVQLDM